MRLEFFKHLADHSEKSKAMPFKRLSKKLRIADLLIFCFSLLIWPTYADNGEKEKAVSQRNKEAAEIYPYTEYTKYESEVEYIKEPLYPTTTVDFVHKVTHFLFDTLIPGASVLPHGYIVKEIGSDGLRLGPKIEKNDWKNLLAHYWVFTICVIALLFLIIIMPFIAVCYYCFNHYRCSKGCPPCDLPKDNRARCGYGFILSVLLIGILFTAIIGFQSNIMLDHGLKDSANIMRRGTENTCKYLKDVSDHIYHLLVFNYEELLAHLTDVIQRINFIMYDATYNNVKRDPKKNLSAIFINLKEADRLMREVKFWQKDLLFYGGQLRDGLRTVKRDIIYACTVLCGNEECLRFLRTSDVHNLDSSKCLHFDKLPDASFYSKVLENENKRGYFSSGMMYYCGHYVAAVRWNYGVSMLKDPLIKDVENGKEHYRIQADNLRNIIDEVVNDIHENSQKSSTSFADLYEKYNTHRNIINAIVCGLLLIILLLLGIALICGCCGRLRRGDRDGFCSKVSGAKCMFLGIFLIFCVFSFVILVGLFYLILGLIMYMGVCAPLRDQQGNAMFRQLNAVIDLTKFQIKNNPEPESEEPTLPMSKVITECRANQTIIELLQENGLYNIDNLLQIKVMGEHKEPKTPFFDYKVEDWHCLNPNGRFLKELEPIWKSQLNPYTGTDFTDNLCTDVTPVALPNLITQLKELRSSLWTQWGIYDWARVSLYDEILNLQKYQDEISIKVIDLINKITENILKIDEYILFERKPFGESLKIIFDDTYKTEVEMRKKARALNTEWRKKIPEHLEDQFADYSRMVIRESKTNVGNCEPIAITYSTSSDTLCNRIVDPLNSLWFGVLLGGLLLLPALFVAHRLMCLYNKIYPDQTQAAEDGYGCPICTGGGLKPPLNHGGHLPDFCLCNEVNEYRYEGGAVTLDQHTTAEVTEPEEIKSSNNKQKEE
ncbi:prominin-like protein [Drosophila grimshawi]|uniref:prominin-like protein n=1 Tax=Drosophila grimshawi TaxID=7222 RepID=UPI000C86E4FB|nr:prominin-like protein [Drosophila grimshawi]